MKTRYSLITVLTVTFTAALYCQEYRGVSLGLTVDNLQGRSETVFAGIFEGASTGLDNHLGEVELPPQPPAEIFDVRMASTPGKSQLGTGSQYDYRPITTGTQVYTETYTIAYQGGINAAKVNISWQDPFPSRVTKLVIDGADMAGKTNVDIPFATGQVTVVITFNYAPLSYTSNPLSLSFDVNNRDPLPSKTVEIIPQGDTGAGWVLFPDVDWVTVEPSAGEGRQTVTVYINTSQLPVGAYNGIVAVRSPSEPARHDIPITMQMTVGINDNPGLPAGMSLGQNYPNPLASNGLIELNLGDALVSRQHPQLVIFDVNGREVINLSDRIALTPGGQTISFTTDSFPAGTYRYTLRYAGFELTRTMVLIK